MAKFPRFLDVLKSIDWDWWVHEEIPIRIDWWPGAEHYWYAYQCRLQIVLMCALVLTLAALFFAYAHTKFRTLSRR